MYVFVTGGAGYIGSQTCKELYKNGDIPICYDNLSTGHHEFIKWGEFIYGDIKDTQHVRSCLKKYRPIGIIHFAAFAYVGESVSNPSKYFHNNVEGTLSLLDAARDEDIKNIIVSSTCAVYGQPAQVPIIEKCPTLPINPYGASKLFMERMLTDYHTAYGLNWTALRYFNAAGCDPDGEIGEWHEPETHLIPRAIGAALGQLPQLEIFGNDYSTQDGTCIRDYIHVKDLAQAHILALEQCSKGKCNCAINLGTGIGISILDIIKHIKKTINVEVPFCFKARRKGDPSILVADPSSANTILNWNPQYSDIETIVNTAIRWTKKLI